jgi:hypothetical protein
MGVTYIEELNVNHSAPAQSAPPLLPPDRKRVEGEVFYVNV